MYSRQIKRRISQFVRSRHQNVIQISSFPVVRTEPIERGSCSGIVSNPETEMSPRIGEAKRYSSVEFEVKLRERIAKSYRPQISVQKSFSTELAASSAKPPLYASSVRREHK